MADHLYTARQRLDGEIEDLRVVRDGGDKKAARSAERRYAKVIKWRDELQEFISAVEECAERGPPPTDQSCPRRQADASFRICLDDGVMVGSAGLWPLLVPQWKDPKKWWKELSVSDESKDYDWSKTAMRYWPSRVDDKCKVDPSLAVAHGCFWKYHPARAWAWELRLQDEIGLDFRIEESPYRGDGGHTAHRSAWLLEHPADAIEAIEKEALRRCRRLRSPLCQFRITAASLWTDAPDRCWALELRLSEKQGVEFLLISPDEPEARKRFETANPDRVAARKRLISNLAPPPELFDSEDADEDEQLEDELDSEETGDEVTA